MDLSVGRVVGWKFNHEPGMVTRDGEIIEWPAVLGPEPTLANIAQWTLEYEASQLAEESRRATFRTKLEDGSVTFDEMRTGLLDLLP